MKYNSAKKIVRKFIAVVTSLSLAVTLAAVIPMGQRASAATVSEKKITITLNKKNASKTIYLVTTDKNSKTSVSVKIKKMTGKVKIWKKVEGMMLFPSVGDDGCGPVLYLQNEKECRQFKQGAVYDLPKKYPFSGWRWISYEMPNGVSSITYEVTYKNNNAIKTVSARKPKGWDKHFKG